MKTFLCTIIAFICALSLSAQTAQEYFKLGNNAYKSGDYSRAIDNYNDAKNAGMHSAELYYNTANSASKLNKRGEAITNYLKAISINPRMREASANLETFASENSLQIPNIAKTEFELSLSEWTLIAFATFWVFIIFIVLPPLYNKSGKATLFLSIVGFVFFCVSAIAINSWLDLDEIAIALADDTPVLISPTENAPAQFLAADGQVAKIKQQHNDYLLLEFPNGKSGWVKKHKVGTLSN